MDRSVVDGPRAPLGIKAGVAAFFLLAFPAFVLTAIGFGNYTESVCFSVFDEPRGASVSRPRFTGPFTLECRRDEEIVSTVDPTLALWVGGIWGSVLLVSTVIGRIAAGTESRRDIRGPWDEV